MSRVRLTRSKTCGRRLYDDYEELRPGAVEDLQVFLTSYGRPMTAINTAAHNRKVRGEALPLFVLLLTPVSFFISLFSFPILDDDLEVIPLSVFYWTGLTISVLLFCAYWSRWLFSQEAESSFAADLANTSSNKGTALTGAAPTKVVGQGLTDRFRKQGLPRHRQDLNEPNLSECSTSNTMPGDQQRHRFLLLCIPFMKWGFKLQQPDVCRIHSDRDFFKLLRQAYLEHRSSKAWRWLRKVRQLDFSQVCPPPRITIRVV